MKRFSVLLLVSTLAAPAGVQAHGGGLDAYGCHHNRKQGGYHCHRGEFAGQNFQSQADMLAKAQAKGKGSGQSQGRDAARGATR